MKVSFRQGIVRQQTDITDTPTFLQYSGGVVSLIVSPDPTIITFAHGPHDDYLFQESQTVTNAWTGPFVVDVDYWLYWDIDMYTGLRTFGHTTVEPKVSADAPPSPVADQHWFDKTNYVMKVYSSGRWIEKIRVFAGKIDNGAVLVPYLPGTQVGLTTATFAGTFIFDEDGKPVKKFDKFGRGKFITTESPLSTQTTSHSNFRLEALVIDAKAIENIPAFSAIAYKSAGKVGLASYLDPSYPAIGIATEDMYTSEVRTFLKIGYLTSDSWNWNVAAGTPIFVGETGELTTTIPQVGSLQQVATVVSASTLYVDVQPIILYS